MSYPTILLDTALEVQGPVVASSIEVIHVAEDPQALTVKAFVDYGVAKTWVDIMDESNYVTNWADTDVSAAIKAWATQSFPAAR
jgi:hypothetical protein